MDKVKCAKKFNLFQTTSPLINFVIYGLGLIHQALSFQKMFSYGKIFNSFDDDFDSSDKLELNFDLNLNLDSKHIPRKKQKIDDCNNAKTDAKFFDNNICPKQTKNLTRPPLFPKSKPTKLPHISIHLSVDAEEWGWFVDFE